MVSAGVVNSFIDREVEAWVLWNLPKVIALCSDSDSFRFIPSLSVS